MEVPTKELGVMLNSSPNIMDDIIYSFEYAMMVAITPV
jgi:hypothetical protein